MRHDMCTAEMAGLEVALEVAYIERDSARREVEELRRKIEELRGAFNRADRGLDVANPVPCKGCGETGIDPRSGALMDVCEVCGGRGFVSATEAKP